MIFNLNVNILLRDNLNVSNRLIHGWLENQGKRNKHVKKSKNKMYYKLSNIVIKRLVELKIRKQFWYVL